MSVIANANTNTNKTLSYYFTEDGKGFQEFKEWFTNNKIIEPIKPKLNSLIIEIEQSIWLDKDKRQTLFQQFKTSLTSYITCITDTDPHTYFLEYINDLDKHCFQGGYGYIVSYTTGTTFKECPHHWMIRTEYDKQFKHIPELILLCATICDLYINIEEKPTHAIWN